MMTSDLEIGQFISSILLIIGFGAQIAGAITLRCVHSGDEEWCSAIGEVDGILAIIGGLFFLVIFSVVSTLEENIGRYARRVVMMNTKMSARR